jgi:hypothetical protein
MGSIHLIYKKNRPEDAATIDKCLDGVDEWVSGNWAISEETAKAMVNGNLYFHSSQSAPSFFGGVILSTQRIQTGKYAGRVIFRFRFDQTFRGVRTTRTGWSQEKKIIR